jgi:hypothetical protein
LRTIFPGVYISDAEIDEILAKDYPVGPGMVGSSPPTIAADIDCPVGLDLLRKRFGLSQMAVDCLLIGLAPELDLRYERLYAYLQDDATKKRPGIDLLLNLLCLTPDRKLTGRAEFAYTRPLLRYSLLVASEADGDSLPLLARQLRLDERVAGFLLGDENIDRHLLRYARQITPATDAIMLPPHPERVAQLLQAIIGTVGGVLALVQGPQGAGAYALAEALSAALDRNLLEVQCPALLAAHDPAALIIRCVREAALGTSVLVWHAADGLLEPERGFERKLLLDSIAELKLPCLLVGETGWEVDDLPEELQVVRIDLPIDSPVERAADWRRILGAAAPTPEACLSLAGRFRLGADQMRQASVTARRLARERDPDQAQLTLADLTQACRLHSNQALNQHGRRISIRRGWNDLVLPEMQLDQLRTICDQVTYRARVYDEWGFDRGSSYGKGLNVLFAGPPGTGKTLAAEVIAGELGLDLYAIDLAQVVSKYIGETEKKPGAGIRRCRVQ